MSIKNKLVTAVTTAGLLAGLFGSAFVPAARAAQSTTGLKVTSTSAVGATATTWEGLATVAPVLVISFGELTATDATNDQGVWKFSVSGGTIASITCAAANAAANPAGNLQSCAYKQNTGAILNTTTAQHWDVVLDDASTVANNVVTVGDKITWTITLDKLSAGSAATVSVTQDGAAITASAGLLKYTAIATSTAANPQAYTADLTVQTTTRAITDDVTATDADEKNGTTDYITAAYAGTGLDAGSYEMDYTIKNSYGAALDISAVQFSAATTCGIVDLGATGGAAGAAGDKPDVTESVAVGSNVGKLFVTVSHPGASKPCVATVTVKHLASGTVIDTFSIGFLGEVASIALTGPSTLASGLASDEDLEDQMVVVAKDAAGVVVPGAAYAAAFTLSKTETGTAPANVALVDTDANGGTADNDKFDLDKDICVAGDDTTRYTRSIYVEGPTKVDLTKAKSSTLTITCGGKDAVVTKAEFTKASAAPGEILTAKLTLVDDAGKPSGIGAYMIGTNFTMTNAPATGGSGTAEPGTTIASVEDGNGTVADAEKGILVTTVGEYTFSWTAGAATGVQGFLLNIVDNDLTVGADPVQGLFTAKVTAGSVFSTTDSSMSVGAKKKVATADFGAAAANKKVAFVLENASGVTKTYYRKANASGVAKYTIALRGTWTVYATFGDDITDTVTLRK